VFRIGTATGTGPFRIYGTESSIIQSGVFCGKPCDGRPVEIVSTPGKQSQESIAQEACQQHWHAKGFRRRQGQAQAPATEPTKLVASCAPCHGFEGIGKDVEIPNLAGQHDVYLSYQLRAFRSGRRKHPDMSFMARKLTDAEINALATYYSGLPPR